MSTRISEKFSREFTYFVQENSPFLSTKIFPPSDVGKFFNFLEDSLKGHAWIIFHSAREVDGTLHCTATTHASHYSQCTGNFAFLIFLN